MGFGGAFFLLFIGGPAIVASALGALFPRHWLLAASGSLAAMALLLLAVNAHHGLVAMLPFLGMVALLAAVPVVAAAFIGSVVRSGFKKGH